MNGIVKTRARRLVTFVATLVVLVCAGGWAPVLHAADNGISVAEQKVFLDDHLRSVGKSGVLRYLFKQAGTLEKNFDDTVVLTIKPSGRDARTVEVAYLTGERKVVLPAIEDAKANPVILFFLEQDVREMHRRLGGSESYFRRRIRLAFAEGAEVRSAPVVVDGKQIAATEVAIRPFVDDPMKAKLGPFERKTYLFTLSDQVPGGVVRLRSLVTADAANGNAASGQTAPLIEEMLSFEKVGK